MTTFLAPQRRITAPGYSEAWRSSNHVENRAPPRSRSYYVNNEYPKSHPYACKLILSLKVPLGISALLLLLIAAKLHHVVCFINVRLIFDQIKYDNVKCNISLDQRVNNSIFCMHIVKFSLSW
jgi:hypothetical protein